MRKKDRERLVSEFLEEYIKAYKARFGIDLVEEEILFLKLKVAILINKII